MKEKSSSKLIKSIIAIILSLVSASSISMYFQFKNNSVNNDKINIEISGTHKNSFNGSFNKNSSVGK